MNWVLAFFVSILVSTCIIVYLVARLLRIREQISIINDTLEDMKHGNLNRRVLTKERDMTKTICYNINEIAINHQSSLIRQKQSEHAYKGLMTSLSHDVKTPLASLVGYLEAIQEKIASEEEKEEYVRVALSKALRLKDFLESLFVWVKLDAREQVFSFEKCDIHELTRDILADWIPVLEEKAFQYEITIPDSECNVRLDRNAYKRITNNLLQNVLLHSEADRVDIRIRKNKQHVSLSISDNGIGIDEKDMPNIFERLYKCDESRSHGGSGLGLAIVKELMEAHQGTVHADSMPGSETVFTMTFPWREDL